MELKEIKKLLKEAFDKTGLSTYKVSTKFDEECEIGFFNNRFYLYNVLTPYSISRKVVPVRIQLSIKSENRDFVRPDARRQ